MIEASFETGELRDGFSPMLSFATLILTDNQSMFVCESVQQYTVEVEKENMKTTRAEGV